MRTVTKTGGRDATNAVVPGRGLLSIGNPKTPVPDGYNWTGLATVARMESGHTPSRLKPEYWNEGIPWIGIRDATGNDGQVIRRTQQSISQLGVDNSSTRLLPAGTVSLSRTASVGYVVQMGVPMCTSQDFVNWVCGSKLNPNYLRYLLLAEAESVRSWATGSTHKTLYFPEAKALHALLPSVGVQGRVAKMLGSLDDKIAANRQTMSVSDALVRALYDRLPLSNVTLDRVSLNVRESVGPAEIAPDEMYVGLEHVERRSLWLAGRGVGADVTSGKSRFIADDVLFGKLRPYFHKVSLASSSGVCSTDILVIRASDPQSVALVAAAASSDALVAVAVQSSNGTKMPRAKWADIASCSVPDPDSGAVREFCRIVDTVASRVARAIEENQRLAATRDELLPLLMSGKITVKDAEKTVEEVV